MPMQADQFRTIRKSAGMTQAEFAEAMGVSRKLIVDLESREDAIDERTALAARFLFIKSYYMRAALGACSLCSEPLAMTDVDVNPDVLGALELSAACPNGHKERVFFGLHELRERML